MKKQEKTHFEDFLKNLFWEKNNNPEISPGIFSGEKNSKKRSIRQVQDRPKNSFKNILNKVESGGRKDFDDFSAFLWQKHFQKHKTNFKKSNNHDYLNQELNPHAHIDIFTEKNSKNKININVYFSPVIVLTSAVLLAIVLTTSVIRFNPLFAEKMVATGDSLIVKPIKITYCSFVDDILCEPTPKYNQNIVIRKKIDKNLLSSYIVNNQAELKNIRTNTSIQIKEEDLDGRVAGVIENNQVEASEELKKISEVKSPEIKKNNNVTKKILEKAFTAQKNLVLKIQNKLIEIVF